MKPFDPTKPCQTRDGRKVRILCTDALGSYPIIALVTNGDFESVLKYSKVGFPHNSGHPDLTLVNIPVKKWQWAYEADNATYDVTIARYTEDEIKAKFIGMKWIRIIGRISETEIEE